MVFTSPTYIPKLPFPPPDSIPIHEFLFGDQDNKYGRYSIEASKPPYTCGLTGKSFTAVEVAERIQLLAAALCSRLECQPDEESELDKVLSIYSLNTIDTLTVSWAAHRLSGVSNNISTSYTASELTHQLKTVKAKALFTCLPLLERALKCAEASDIPRERVFLLEVPSVLTSGFEAPKWISTVDDLIQEGRSLPSPRPLVFTEGQGARQTAFLCCSSGTSGVPKNVKLSHVNVIANILQIAVSETTFKPVEPEMSLGVLPLSHNFALIAVSQASVYRGDGVVIMPRFDLLEVLQAIDKFRLGRLWLVPQMVMAMLQSPNIVQKYNLSHVGTAVVGASVLSKHVSSRFSEMMSGCHLVQGYGLTETTVAVTLENPGDNMFGSCGHLFPGCEGRLLDEQGQDITEHDTPGQLMVRSPTVMIGYLNNDVATAEMLKEDGWLDTGDLVEFRKSPAGHSHLFHLDRVKELIKVRSLQVSPTELESHLLLHPIVQDSAVVPLPDDIAGELPLAYIVKHLQFEGMADSECLEALHSHVSSAFAEHKHLAGGIVFVKALPKSPAGKTKRVEVKHWARSLAEERKAERKDAEKTQIYVFDSDSDEE